jgi:hypothetical protein
LLNRLCNQFKQLLGNRQELQKLFIPNRVLGAFSHPGAFERGAVPPVAKKPLPAIGTRCQQFFASTQ